MNPVWDGMSLYDMVVRYYPGQSYQIYETF